jgi:hypothetical protein
VGGGGGLWDRERGLGRLRRLEDSDNIGGRLYMHGFFFFSLLRGKLEAWGIKLHGLPGMANSIDGFA